MKCHQEMHEMVKSSTFFGQEHGVIYLDHIFMFFFSSVNLLFPSSSKKCSFSIKKLLLVDLFHPKLKFFLSN